MPNWLDITVPAFVVSAWAVAVPDSVPVDGGGVVVVPVFLTGGLVLLAARLCACALIV